MRELGEEKWHDWLQVAVRWWSSEPGQNPGLLMTLLSPSSESPEARGPQLATGPQGTWSTDPQPAATTGAVLHLGWNRSLQGGHQEMPATEHLV